MASFLEKTFRIRPDEQGLVFTMGFVLLVNSLTLNVSDVVAVSGFLSEVGTPQILLVWIVDMMLIVLMTGLQSFILDRYGRRAVLRTMTLAIMGAYVVLRLLFNVSFLPRVISYSLLYLLAEQQGLFFPLVFWVLANDMLDMTRAKRLFPFIASWAFIGQILGLGLGAVAPTLVRGLGGKSTELLTLNVLLLLVAYLLMTGKLNQAKIRKMTLRYENARETLLEGWGFVKEVPSFRYLMLSMVAVFAALAILDFNFLFVSDHTSLLADTASFQRFYGLFYLAIAVAAFLIQSLLTSRLIDRLGLKNTFLIMPFVLLLGGASALLAPGNLFNATIGLALPYLAKDTVDQPAHKALQALVPEERRGRVSLFMDSYLYAGGTILGCIVTGIIVVASSSSLSMIPIYLVIGMALAVLGIWGTFKTRRHYETSLLNWRLKRRTRGASVLDGIEF
jgi:AAA family ATP:ADP antiporter